MSLSLGDAGLTVPAAGAGAFRALGDLLLSHARVEPGGVDERNLSHLLSASCCPQLRRLRLEHIAGLAALRLDAAATLEELRLEHLRDLASLELDAPGLRALHVADCYKMADDEASATISAPRLEALACAQICHPDRLRFDGATSVRRLEKIVLDAHGPAGENINAEAVGLLQHCTTADSLGVKIWPYQAKEGEDIEDLMSVVPNLPNIINLTIDADRAHLEASIARLIAKCTRVERVSIDIGYPCQLPCLKPHCFCHREDGWDWDGMNISLEHLREVKITGFLPSEHHRSLLRLMIASAPALENMTVESYSGKELDGSIPCDRGHWTPCTGAVSGRHGRVTIYEWTPDKRRDG